MFIFAFLVLLMHVYLEKESLIGILIYQNLRNAIFSFLASCLKENMLHNRQLSLNEIIYNIFHNLIISVTEESIMQSKNGKKGNGAEAQ